MAENEPVITDENVEKAQTLLDKYYKAYQDTKTESDKTAFLKPIAEGFTPKTTNKATSLFGMKTNPAVLAAIGGLASGFSGGNEKKADLSTLKYQQGLDKEEFDKATKLAGSYATDTKEFKTRQTAWNTINAVAKDPSPAGDLALIFAYMKLLDPGSTVREGEFANAENAGSVPQAIINKYNRVISGERLKETRNDFINKARTIYGAQENSYVNTLEEFKKKATTAGLSDKYIESYIPDYRNSTSKFDLQSLKSAISKPATQEEPVKKGTPVLSVNEKDKQSADFILKNPSSFSPEEIAWAKKITGAK